MNRRNSIKIRFIEQFVWSTHLLPQGFQEALYIFQLQKAFNSSTFSSENYRSDEMCKQLKDYYFAILKHSVYGELMSNFHNAIRIIERVCCKYKTEWYEISVYQLLSCATVLNKSSFFRLFVRLTFTFSKQCFPKFTRESLCHKVYSLQIIINVEQNIWCIQSLAFMLKVSIKFR